MVKKSQKNKLGTNLSKLLIVALGVLVVAQIIFNVLVWQYLLALDNRALAIDAADAISRSMSEKKYLDSQGRITESRLQIASHDNIDTIRYSYLAEENDFPESLHITTSVIAENGVAALRGRGIDALPIAGACERAFVINFKNIDSDTNENNDLELSGKIILSDDRTMYIWREKTCYQYTDTRGYMVELEKLLLQTKSY